jgi:hypothetical protein
MKQITITCDHCSLNIDVTKNEFITIGSEDERSFKFENTIDDGTRLIKLTRYHDLHFCSKDHFIKSFFPKK